MKKFITSVFIMFMVFICANLGISFFLIEGLVYEKYEKEKIVREGDKYNTVIFSDSHGWSLTNGKLELEEQLKTVLIHNFSYGSDSYSDILIKLRWLLDEGVEVHTIFLSVDDHMLTKKSSNGNRTIVYSRPKWHHEVYGISYVKYIYYNIIRYIPTLYPSNQQLIKKYVLNKCWFASEEDELVTNWSKISLESRIEKIQSRIKQFYPSGKFVANRILVQSLKEIIHLSHKQNIKVVGIKFPIDSLMIKEYKNIGALDQVLAISLKLGVDTVLDYRDKYNDPIYMGNQDHVNKLGAQMLVKDLIKASTNKYERTTK